MRKEDYQTVKQSLQNGVIENLRAWFGSDDFKARLSREVNLPYDTIIARITAKVLKDPDVLKSAALSILGAKAMLDE